MSDTAAPNAAAAADDAESRWQQWHRRMALALGNRCRISEAGAAAQGRNDSRIDERIIQAVWADQMLRRGELATASGKALEIIETGRWNTSRGPDFLDARIRLAGEVLCGDIEIHVDSADWRRHGHHQDFEYNRVVLHVALRAHDDRPFEDKQNGERLERLVLEHLLEPDLETIRNTINLGDYPYGRPNDAGLCHEEFLRLPEDELVEFLRLAGQTRMEQKVARFAAQCGTASFIQVLYQALMTAQGFKSSKTL